MLKNKYIDMDKITSSLVKELLETQEIPSEWESRDFEKLVNYSVISNEYNKTFDIESVSIWSWNDTWIDWVAIVVNGQLIESTVEVDDLIEKNNFLEV